MDRLVEKALSSEESDACQQLYNIIVRTVPDNEQHQLTLLNRRTLPSRKVQLGRKRLLLQVPVRY
jgi:hypothetical protein